MKTNQIMMSSLAVLALSCSSALAAATSGTCGGDCKWELDGTTLKISGSGSMDNYVKSGDTSTAPWAQYNGIVTKVEIGNGITSIGERAFAYNTSLESINFGENSQLTTIGKYAFQKNALINVSIPSSVTIIE